MSVPDRLVAAIERRKEELLREIREIVEIETPSTDKAAVDRLGKVLAGKLADLGCKVTTIPREGYGDCLVGRWAPAGAATPAGGPLPDDGKPLLLLCHFDTVWSVGTLAERPWRVEGGKAYGPGAFDMKAGLVFSLFALRTLLDLGRAPRRPLLYLFTTDEEIGSPSTRELIERHARECAATLCLEPATAPHGAVKTARKGWGRFEVRVTGRSAHAGGAHEQGVNALEELARQIQELHALTDYARGVTVTVGMAQGGTRPNVIPDLATATIDLRASTRADLEAATAAILARRPNLPGAGVQVTGGINRLPFERAGAVVALYQHARGLAAELGFDLPEGSTGGVSDGNFTAALGIPTIDGIGALGDGAHALHEHVVVDELPRRCALVARLMETL